MRPRPRQVRWAHHPGIVKDLIRSAGFRPMSQQCFANCSRLAFAARCTPYERAVRYCEGWATIRLKTFTIPIHHAWLQVDSQLVDLTLDPTIVMEYDLQHILTPVQVIIRAGQLGYHGPYFDLQTPIDTIVNALDCPAVPL